MKKESPKLQVVAAYHDLDVWASCHMDYLGGSAAMARKHIAVNRMQLLPDEIAFIIENHHKLTRIKGNVEAEAFRKADLIDLTSGLIRFNIPQSLIIETERQFPRLHFTRTVLKKTARWALLHPLRPLPMLRW